MFRELITTTVRTFRFIYKDKEEVATIISKQEVPEGVIYLGEYMSTTYNWYYLYKGEDAFYAVLSLAASPRKMDKKRSFSI